MNKFDRNSNFGCVNYNSTCDGCIQCGICERPELTEEDCVYDPDTKCWVPKDILKDEEDTNE